jgi:predicted nucleotidyltransferase
MSTSSALEGALGAELENLRGLVSAYLFGSVAAGRTHRESDVDLAILLDRRDYPSAAERFDVRLRLAGRLRAAVRRDVDLVVLNDAPPQLARAIMTAGRRLVLRDPALDHAHSRLMWSRAADLEPFLRRTRKTKLENLGR